MCKRIIPIWLFIFFMLSLILVKVQPNQISAEEIANQKKLDTLKTLYIVKTKALREIYSSDVWIEK